ncbi:MAG: GTP-binding protein [bacterium]|nr:GTP-binding protein [bacterium]
MIPVCLVTGFLGSGKTTFLKRIVARNRERRLVYLVNEFSPQDVDGHVLGADTDDLVALPGGSIFCTCLVSEFIATLKGLPDRFASTEAPIDGLVIEASGVANPKVVERMLRETELDRVYHLASVVCVADPSTFPKLVQALPNTAAQVESSDVVILNKTDLFGEDLIGQTEDELRRIRPDVTIHRAIHCDVEVDLFSERSPRGIDGEYAACADPNFARFSVRFTGDVALEALRRAVEEAGEIVYRLKGFVTVNGANVHIDYTPAGVNTEMVETCSSPPGLTVIVRGDAYEQGRQLVENLKNAQTGESPDASL